MPCILITVDVEDWFQVENLRPHFPRSAWDTCELRVEANTRKLLDLFEQHEVSATFFILGWLAERCPGLVKEIRTRGHEIASHGYNHELCSNMSMSDLREDLYRSKALLEDITGQPIHGYRAPSFSISDKILKLIEQCGYLYDSSYNSFGMHGRYGRIHMPPGRSNGIAVKLSEKFYELPISNLEFTIRNSQFTIHNSQLIINNFILPWGGGGYFRLLPVSLFKQGVKQILRKTGCYIFYCHPWEFDPDQPRVDGMRPDLRFRHYVNIRKNTAKLKSFMSAFSSCNFVSCSDFLRASKRGLSPRPLCP